MYNIHLWQDNSFLKAVGRWRNVKWFVGAQRERPPFEGDGSACGFQPLIF
jgi:hypothetical protein